ncbi:hypothetical protein AURDEDRAFT_131419 [Auricularia subglabra TFB-10046 SS5]|uniref:Uncharacterized protein n=1 Tax=Auricularia subglabra (strain TFB-10046 / SS5) TaxID=717982 RepID=J0CUG3_AURST|nr:hypothetical protein AURDEDRAFT_131419 [Auricularia subglabra TFB-10046 SS5]
MTTRTDNKASSYDATLDRVVQFYPDLPLVACVRSIGTTAALARLSPEGHHTLRGLASQAWDISGPGKNAVRDALVNKLNGELVKLLPAAARLLGGRTRAAQGGFPVARKEHTDYSSNLPARKAVTSVQTELPREMMDVLDGLPIHEAAPDADFQMVMDVDDATSHAEVPNMQDTDEGAKKFLAYAYKETARLRQSTEFAGILLDLVRADAERIRWAREQISILDSIQLSVSDSDACASDVTLEHHR